MRFLKRNISIIVIATVTLGAFLTIIIMGQKHPTESPILKEVDEEDLIYTHTYIRGSPNAPVTLIEFADFKSKECAEYYPTIELLYEKYKNQLRIALRHLPTSDEAKIAATAAQIAGEYNDFWEYANVLFVNQDNKFNKDTLTNYAKNLNIPEKAFGENLESETFDPLIDADIKSAQKLGVTDVPTFFLNGRRMTVTGTRDFQRQIEAEIAKHLPKEPSVEVPTEDSSPLESISTTTGTNTRELTPEELAESKTVLEIRYTTNGWNPEITKGYTGQTVRWTNTTASAIVLKQLDYKFPEFKGNISIEPGGTFEFVLYKDNLWRYEEVNSHHFGYINIITPKL